MREVKHPARAFAMKRSVVVTGVALSMMIASSAQAQTAQQSEKVERIEVTGSRVPAINVEGASPVTVIDAASIKVDGLRSVENLLNNLPQVVANQGAMISNGASGTATVDLRGLGPSRALVLVNGRRLPAGSPLNYAADLNQIPAPLIRRIEVLTGGASSVYGSDAMAGVVNFILNDRFEGVQFELNQSFYNHKQGHELARMIGARALSNSKEFSVPGDKSSDGRIYDANVLMGGNFANNKGNATLYVSYKKEEALLQSERDFSACSIGGATTGGSSTINGVAFGPGFRCGGSGTSFPGRFFTAAGQRTVADANGNTRAWVAANDQYNFGPLNYYQRPSERYGMNATANYEILPNARLYSEFGFHDDRTVAQIAPSGLFGFDASGANAIRYENPFLSDAWRSDLGLTAPGQTAEALIFRRNVEGGGRQADLRHSSFRSVLGVKGELGKVWNFDAFMQTAKVIYQQTFKNDFSIARTAKALDAVLDASGNVVCRSFLDGTDRNCSPYNIWALGKISAASLAYLSTPGFQRGFTSQKVQGANVNADLGNYGWTLPAAKSGVGVAFGLERRVEQLELDTDTAFTTGDLAGGGGSTKSLGGKFTVKEAFGEVRVPIMEQQPFADVLSVNASYRRAEYSTGPKTDSMGFGIEWGPVREFRLRGSYQEASRAADVIQLFAAVSPGLYNMNADPCGPTRTATAAQCARTGLAADRYGSADLDSPAGQYNGIFGGNASLQPEKSKSSTVGMVFTPMRNLSATIDYYNIKIDKTIGATPPQTILAQCLETGSPTFCSLITRDRLGTLWALPAAAIVATNLNLGKLGTSGIDFGVNYKHGLSGYGGLEWSFNGTLAREFLQEPIPGLGEFDCVGLHGANCGVPLPKWRHKLRATWETPWNVDVALTWRFFGKVDQEGTSTAPGLATEVLPADRTLARQNYLDLAGTWAVTKQWTLRAGINNLLDRDPPISGSTGSFSNGNTYPQAYDALGRRVFFNVMAKF